MDWDELAEEQSQRYFAAWLRGLMRETPGLFLSLAGKHRPESKPVEASDPMTGAFNICSVVTFEDGFKAIVRLPILGRSRFRVEKTNDELLIMAFLTPRTAIPLPTILGTGPWEYNPYVVMTFVEGVLLSHCLRDPSVQSPSLRPDVADSDLARAYRAMAGIVLELYKLTFPRIGAVCHVPGAWKIGKRPLTLNMNELVRVGNFPPKEFSQDTFQSASDYFQELANQHFLHLQYQRNNAIKDADDCRKKYTARCLFRKITREIRTEKGPFRLYCDDLRPSNVIVTSESDFTVKGVIDWEYTYSAPVEFSYAAPWWLLLETPESWEDDLHVFLGRYRPRLAVWLAVLRACEDEKIAKGEMGEGDRLSGRMEQSLDNGVFWLCLAARRSQLFDDIYWTFLDGMFFGEFTTMDDRYKLLSEEERVRMDGFVEEKMRQKEERQLDEHMTIEEVMSL
ncbi:phosphotransferase enzyme family protein [Stachybotrys elegans]|uniref:Phosphotransferase enzyme family protein n=1 Tax=Stachybotrys elegans TaxID=80388 RepID=A0A8K0SLJ6_9HYPO|nr:phosphotransferase enzyme family protein [Stachybotrys elegans]